MKNTLTHSALALLCCGSAATYAANQLEEIVVTSSRVPMPLRHIGTSVSVINEQEIQQRGFNSLADILRSQPSVAVSNNGGAGKISTLRIRGEEGYRTLVLLDGIDISDSSGPQFSPRVEHLLSSGISRVEILRGPQGLMYGADAGGVVNISSTRPAGGFVAHVNVEAGRYGNRQLATDIANGNDIGDFNLSVVNYDTDGFNARSSDVELADDDGYDNSTVHGRAGLNINQQLRLELVARNVDGDSEYDGCYTVDTFSPSNVCSSDYRQRAGRAALKYSSETLNHELSYSASETTRQDYTEGKPSFGSEGELETLTFLGSYQASEHTRLVYGFDLETAQLDDGGKDRERDNNGYYAEYQGGFSDSLYITLGLRYDDNEDFGHHISYRSSAAYLFDLENSAIKLKASYGTGFRAPSLYEIAYNERSVYSPAAEVTLEEEQSRGYDLGVSWNHNNGSSLELVYFDQQVDAEIYFDPDFYSGYLQDRGKTESRGVELISEVSLPAGFYLNGNYTYNDTRTADGSTRARRPRNLVNLGLQWRGLGDRLQLGINARGASGAEESSGKELDDYQVWDINASFQVIPALQVYARVENMLDEEYQEVDGFNSTAAAAYAGVRLSF